VRLFIGLELGEAFHAAMAAALRTVRPLSPDSKWVDPGKAHLTLVFMGNQEESMVARLDAAVRPVVAQHRHLTLELEGAGTFGSPARPRVLWVDVRGQVDRLRSLQAAVAKAVRGLEIELEDRPFSAHLTLARARHPRGDAGLVACREALQKQHLGEVAVREVILFHSLTSPQGARHQALHRWPLSEWALVQGEG